MAGTRTYMAAALFAVASSSACGGQAASVTEDAATGSVSVDAAPGSIAVDARVELVDGSSCLGISSFSITPSSIAPGQAAALAIETEGSPASIQWSVSPASAGTFSNPMSAQTTFECDASGLVTVFVQVELVAPDGGASEGGAADGVTSEAGGSDRGDSEAGAADAGVSDAGDVCSGVFFTTYAASIGCET